MAELKSWKIGSALMVFMLVLALGAALIPATAGTAAAGAWNLQTIDPTQIVRDTDIALDSKGYPHISYYGGSDYSNGALKYARWTGSACTAA